MQAKGQGIIDKMDSMRCKNGSYRRSFIVRHHDSYTDKAGKKVFVNMYQNIECFDLIARMVKAELADGDEVYFLGDLKSRETEYETVHFIEITRLEDLVKIPRGWNEKNATKEG